MDNNLLVNTPKEIHYERQGLQSICAVICTRDRPQQLRRALQSLLDQTQPPEEILVVDNTSRDDTTQRLIHAEFPGVRYVQEPKPGLDFARNRALNEVSQEIVGFLDDDAVAEREWLANTNLVFGESATIAICTGKVEALSLETAGQRLCEANGGYARGNTRIRLPADRRRRLHGLWAPLIAWANSIGGGCSMAVRRHIILELGGFDEALDMGAPLAGGGDFDIIWRTLNAGYEVIYEPRVQARHEHRREIDAAISQILAHNRALIVVLTKAARNVKGSKQLSIWFYLLWRLMKPGIRLARRAVRHDPLPFRVLLRLWWHSWRGLGAYAGVYRLAGQRQGIIPNER